MLKYWKQNIYGFQYIVIDNQIKSLRSKKSKIKKLMNIPTRTWNEQDFNQFYQQQPKIITTNTYITVHLLVSNDIMSRSQDHGHHGHNDDDGREVWIDVKIPSNAHEEVFRCLMYKALYYYYLDCKIDNPLFRTACVVFFQSFNGFQDWYHLTMCNRSIRKGTKFFPITLNTSSSIHRYIPFTSLKSDILCENQMKVLARSRKNSKYYNIYIYNKTPQNTNQNYLLILHDRYKKMQHPFLCSLQQFHQSANNKYFIFEHHAFTFKQLLNSSNFKPTKQQLLLALVYLQQQNIGLGQMRVQHILVGFDGHILVSQQAVNLELRRNQAVLQSETKISKNMGKFKFFQDLLKKLMEKTEINKMEVQQFENLTNFIENLSSKRKTSLKDILSHTLIHQFDINKILQKSLTPLPTPSSLQISPIFQYIPLQKSCISQFTSTSTSNSPYTSSRFPYIYQSYQLAGLTSNQQIVSKYQYFMQGNYGSNNSNSKPTSSRVLRARKNNCQNYTSTRSQNNQEDQANKSNNGVSLERKTAKGQLYKKLAAIQQQHIKSGAIKSPYMAVLKKQCSLQRKKKVNF